MAGQGASSSLDASSSVQYISCCVCCKVGVWLLFRFVAGSPGGGAAAREGVCQENRCCLLYN